MQQHKEYTELMAKGYEFDIVEETFYVPYDMLESFKFPKGYEDWKLSPFIFDSKWKEENEKKLAKFEKPPFVRDEYLNQRLKECGIEDQEDNLIQLKGGIGAANEITTNQIFSANKHGDIEILLYSLHRKPFVYTKDSKNKESGSKEVREELAVLTRHHPRRETIFCLDPDSKKGKYDFDKSRTGNHLMWHPTLIEQYENKEEIETLVLTEGFFKAFTATQNGIPTVGLPSITIFTEKKGATNIHTEIIDFIIQCKVKNVVVLWDADCRNISGKALQNGDDLYSRPGLFVHMADKIRGLLREKFNSKELNIHFGRILSKEEGIEKDSKGLDDLLNDYPEKKEQIRTELYELPKVNYFFRFIDISNKNGIKNINTDFYLDKVENFYRYHEEKIKGREFVFRGSTYEVNEKGEPTVKIPANVKAYKRIGSDYYKLIQSVVPAGGEAEVTEEKLIPWTKTAIIDDHGKNAINHIERFNSFTNFPSHTDYRRRINNQWNLYSEVHHDIEPGEFPVIEQFLKHIFNEQYEYGLDYIKLMYERPFLKVPILCLVSRENETGKSTFINFMKRIFKANMAVVTNTEMEGDFNSSWVDKKIIANEETALEKHATKQKLKFLSTTKFATRNEKNRSAGEIPFFGSFIFCSNDEKKFLRMSADDKRFWVRKIPMIPKEHNVPNFEDRIEEELPHFLHFLLNREMEIKTPQSRMWFNTEHLRTEAFYKAVNASLPTVEKEIKIQMEESFISSGLDQILMTTKDIREHFGLKKYEQDYVNEICSENLALEKLKGKDGKTKVKKYRFPSFDNGELKMVKSAGRPWVFNRKDFVHDDIEMDPQLDMENKSITTDFDKDQEELANEILN
jgi:hypothetical protein